MSGRGWSAAAIAAVTFLTLSACASGSEYSDLNRPATADDKWPSSLPEYASNSLDPESSRLVGHDGSTALYLATSTQPSGGVCLLIYPGDENWVVGCGMNGVTVGGGGSPTYVVEGDGSPREGNAISENVFIEER